MEEEGIEWRPREMRKTEREIRDLGKTSKEVAGREEESAKRALEGWVEDVKRVRCSLLLLSREFELRKQVFT